jgi:hypothetical protein
MFKFKAFGEMVDFTPFWVVKYTNASSLGRAVE